MNWHSLIGLNRHELELSIGQKPDVVLNGQMALDLCPVSADGLRIIDADEYIQWNNVDNRIVVVFLVKNLVVQVQTGSRELSSN